MKLSKKIGCVLLALLMFASSMTVGFAATADEILYGELVDLIMEGTDEPDPTYDYYVKDLSHYAVSDNQGNWSDEGNTLTYEHVVTAKDNDKNAIRATAKKFYEVVNLLQSTTNGQGAYNTEMIAAAIKERLYTLLSGEKHIVRTDSTGEKVYVPATGIAKPSDLAVKLYGNAKATTMVLPSNATNRKVYWRLAPGNTMKDCISIGQDGTVYGMSLASGFPVTITFQCIAVDMVTVTSPAEYDEEGNLTKGPQLYIPNNAVQTFSVRIADDWDNRDDRTNAYNAFDRTKMPDWNEKANRRKTDDEINAELAALVPEYMPEDNAKTVRQLLDAEKLTDGDYQTLVTNCYDRIKAAAKEELELDISNIDFANLTGSGLETGAITALRKLITEQAEETLSACGYTDYYDFYNVETLVNYFMGASNTINSANWFHTFRFTVQTDMETALLCIFNRAIKKDPNGSGVGLDMMNAGDVNALEDWTTTFTWKHKREYDPSGTVATYVLADTYQSSEEMRNNTAREYIGELQQVNTAFNGVLGNVPGDVSTWNSKTALDRNTAAGLDNAMVALKNKNYSTELLVAAFGKKYYAIDAVYNLYRPNATNDGGYAFGFSDSNSVPGNHRQLYGYRANVSFDADGKTANPFSLTNTKMYNLVGNITNLINDPRLGVILNTFVNFNDPKYIGTAVYGMTYTNVSEMLTYLIRSFLYSDNLPYLLLDKVYPALQNLLENTLPGVISGAISESTWNFLTGLLGASRDVAVILTNALGKTNNNNIDGPVDGVAIYPYQIAVRMQQRGYDTQYPEIYRILSQAKFRRSSNSTRYPGWETLTEAEKKTLANNWHVNNRTTFVNAMNVALVGLEPLLTTLLGDDEFHSEAAGFGFTIGPLWLYECALAAILDALRIPNLKDAAAFNALSDKDILPYLLNTLLDWVENDVLTNPIDQIANLVVRLDSLLGFKGNNNEYPDGYLQWAVNKTQGLDGLWVAGINVGSIANLNAAWLYNTIKGALGDKKLDSINNIIESFVNFGAPTVLRYNQYGQPVFQKTDENGHVGETLDKNEADKTPVKLPPIQSGKLRDCGYLLSSYTCPLINNTGFNTFNNTFYRKEDGVSVQQVLLYLLRYVFYGIMSVDYTNRDANWSKLPSLIDAFMDPWNRTNELFGGLTIDGILNNIVYHPEEALCALVEIFQPNETHSDTRTGDAFNNVYSLAYPDYRQDVLLAKDENGNYLHTTFGARVNYTKYWTKPYAQDAIKNLREIVDNVMKMLGYGTLKDLLTGLLNDNLYTSKMLSMIANLIYTNLGNLQSTIDLQSILGAALDMKYDPITFYNTLAYSMLVRHGFKNLRDIDTNRLPLILTHMQDKLRTATTSGTQDVAWSSDFFYNEDGSPIDWGLGEDPDHSLAGSHNIKNEAGEVTGVVNLTAQDVFFDALGAILAPLAPVIKLIVLGDDLNLFNLIKIPMYQVYHYALVPILEALGVPNLVAYTKIKSDSANSQVATTNNTMWEITNNDAATYDNGVTVGCLDLFGDIFEPVSGFLTKVLNDPITTVLDLLPNLLFFLTVGTVNDAVNNLVHFAYVLMDIVKPIVDLKPILNNLLSGIEVMGVPLNLSLPLNIDFNSLINQLIGSLTKGTTVGGALQGSGIEVTDGLYIKLPPIDLSMLCAGTLAPFTSISEERGQKLEIVRINTGSGADLITVLLRFVMDTLFMYDNSVNISVWAADKGMMDGLDSETVFRVLTTLNTTANENGMPDKSMYILFLLLRYLVPISGTLSDKLAAYPVYDENGELVSKGITVTDFFGQLTSGGDAGSIFDMLKNLLTASDDDGSNPSAPLSFLERLILFFKRLVAAIKELFHISIS